MKAQINVKYFAVCAFEIGKSFSDGYFPYYIKGEVVSLLSTENACRLY